MFSRWWCYNLIISLVLVLSFTQTTVGARRVLLRPLTAKQVYGALRSAGREDAIPEGRVVSQGISAATGFTLGLIKGVGGTMLATSNATTEWLNNLNLTAHIPNVDLYSLLPNVNLSLPNIDYSALIPTINLTGIDYHSLLPTVNLSGIDYSALLPNLNITTLFTHKASGSNSSASTSYVVQEICFQTRRAESNAKVQGRQAVTSPTTTATTTGVGTASPTTTGTASPTGTGMATISNTASATADLRFSMDLMHVESPGSFQEKYLLKVLLPTHYFNKGKSQMFLVH
ncbi:uncharacterized protein LOC101894679 [Musca domestica]|uniref:Uncharacterized protein LOC101894679 n=1 Tax=Musca domestica TaxID=7370 RepID=A0A9J7DLX3_MUSDO|nr:uncharacterized protein LOC101894679 [Musca domestica]